MRGPLLRRPHPSRQPSRPLAPAQGLTFKARRPLQLGLTAALFPCDGGPDWGFFSAAGESPYQPRACRKAEHPPSRQYVHAMANYPEGSELQCDSAGNVRIGPPDGADYRHGMPPGTLNINPDTQGIKFKVVTHTLDSWAGAAGNTLGGVLAKLKAQAATWFELGVRGIVFPAFARTDADDGFFDLDPQWKYLREERFQFQDFAWFPMGRAPSPCLVPYPPPLLLRWRWRWCRACVQQWGAQEPLGTAVPRSLRGSCDNVRAECRTCNTDAC